VADLRAEMAQLEVPDAAASEERAWRLLDSAFDERTGTEKAHGFPRLPAAAIAVVAMLLLALTPAGAEVRDWIREAIGDVGEPDARPALTHLPAPGALLVTTGSSVSVVREDGSHRRLGRFDDVAWSPHGLYVATAAGRTLSARASSGGPRWEIKGSRSISDPAWSPNEGFRVAYRDGDELRVAWGDGTNDAAIGPSRDVTPAWQPRTGSRNVLAYADRRFGRIRIVDVDSGQIIARGQSPGTPIDLDWSRDGSQLLVTYRAGAVALDTRARPLRTYDFGRAGSGFSLVSAAFLPGTETVAALLRSDPPSPVSRVVLGAPLGGEVTKRTIFTGSGRLRGLTVAPNGRQLQVAWPRADQWLFIPTLHTNRIDAVGNIRRQFGGVGERAFPTVAGWCCQARG
jgi:hypothetical protein